MNRLRRALQVLFGNEPKAEAESSGVEVQKELPDIEVRIRLAMNRREQEAARKLARFAPRGGRVKMSTLVDSPLATLVVRKLVMSGVIVARAQGIHGTEITVLDSEAWRRIAGLKITGGED